MQLVVLLEKQAAAGLLALSQCLDEAVKWLGGSCLKLNPFKTDILGLGKTEMLAEESLLRPDGLQPTAVNSVESLGYGLTQHYLQIDECLWYYGKHFSPIPGLPADSLFPRSLWDLPNLCRACKAKLFWLAFGG